jgi:fimbrial chaperone protein
VDFQAQAGEASRNVSLKFLIEYVASLYLVPPRARPRMRLLSHSVTDKGVLEILVANEGTAHQLLEQLEIVLHSGGKDLRPTPEQMKDLRTENVLAGGQRLLRLPLPKGAAANDLKVSVKFTP